MIYTTSSGSKVNITKHNSNNTYIGIFIHNKNMPKIYGDSINEVIDEAEEMEKEINE